VVVAHVVDQHPQPAERLGRGVDEPLRLRLDRDVGRQGHGAHAQRLGLGHDGPGLASLRR
jgi:hypothetical protein